MTTASSRKPALAALLAATLACVAWSPTATAAKPAPSTALDKSKHKKSGVCSDTARSALKACDLDAPGEYHITLGKCANVADPTDRANCTASAKDDLKSAYEDCRDQYDARRDVCGQIGEGAYDVAIDPNDFLDKPGILAQPNRYFPLVPGRTYVYQHGTETVRTTITDETKQILGVTVIVVHDVSIVDGLLTEDTEDWFAQDTQGNVWYFGEIAQQLENGELVSLEGSWKAGVDGAQPGIVMKGVPQIGDVYRQEFSLGDAEDLGEVLSLTGTASTPKASCNQTCLVTKDFSPLEPDVIENKYFAPDVGLILTVDTAVNDREELVDILVD